MRPVPILPIGIENFFLSLSGRPQRRRAILLLCGVRGESLAKESVEQYPVLIVHLLFITDLLSGFTLFGVSLPERASILMRVYEARVAQRSTASVCNAHTPQCSTFPPKVPPPYLPCRSVLCSHHLGVFFCPPARLAPGVAVVWASLFNLDLCFVEMIIFAVIRVLLHVTPGVSSCVVVAAVFTVVLHAE